MTEEKPVQVLTRENFELREAPFKEEIAQLRAEIERHCQDKAVLLADASRANTEIERLRNSLPMQTIAHQQADNERLRAGVRDAIEALERGSTSAPVLEALRALDTKP